MAGLYWYRFQPATSTIAEVGSPAPRVGLVLPYWDFWEGSVPYGLRAEREALAGTAAEALAADGSPSRRSTPTPPARRPHGRFAETRAEAVLVMQTMAVAARAHAGRAGSAAGAWSGRPRRRQRVPDTFDHGGITSSGHRRGADGHEHAGPRRAGTSSSSSGRWHEPSRWTPPCAPAAAATPAWRMRASAASARRSPDTTTSPPIRAA